MMIDGALAGLVAGVAVMVLLLVHDFLVFEPFDTPRYLAERLIRFEGSLEMLSRAARIAGFTVIHLAVFTCLGIGAAALLRWSRLPNSVLLALLYGLVVCTIVFDLSLGLSETHIGGSPAWPIVLWANGFAGGVIGLVLRVKAP